MSERDDDLNFARNVAMLRERQGMSQSELARRMVERGFDSYSQMTVSRTEKGQRPVRLGEARVLAEILGSRVFDMTRGSATEQIIGAVDGVADALADLMGSVGAALTEYALQLDEAAGLVEKHAQHEEIEVREAASRLSSLMLPATAVARWAAEVAVTQGSLREDFEIRASDIVRMRELANEDERGELGRGERQAEV
ncbi:helix-turn-helix transcriptional regulator [Microbacterium sp. NPDC089180]|uniref:helix-turn-helix transcriptional regulator n=1 Tax=unclassified Microbacterium TaxID=2609290 RepID=UPI003417BBD0